MKTVTAATPAEDQRVMSLLHDHVPLALLCDLAGQESPQSAEILEAEGSPDVHWWEP